MEQPIILDSQQYSTEGKSLHSLDKAIFLHKIIEMKFKGRKEVERSDLN